VRGHRSGDRPYGSRADTLVVMASTDSSKGSKGISAFIVDGDTPGLKKGQNLDKLGFRSSDTVALFLENVRVPGENLLGQLNEGFTGAMRMLDEGRIGLAAMAVGTGRGCLKKALPTPESGMRSVMPSGNSRQSRGCSATWRPKSTRHGC